MHIVICISCIISSPFIVSAGNSSAFAPRTCGMIDEGYKGLVEEFQSCSTIQKFELDKIHFLFMKEASYIH